MGKANSIHAAVSLGSTPKSLYILLSNYSTNSAAATITHNNKIIEAKQEKLIEPGAPVYKSIILRAPKYVREFSSKLNRLLQKPKEIHPQAKAIEIAERRADVAGQKKSFCINIDENGNCTQSTTAAAKKIVSDIPTQSGSKTLNIWVSDDSFDSGSGCSKSKCVTQAMVDELAKRFLATGDDNDIYDWVTNIYEGEWGDDAHGKYPELIGANDEISILLTDIDQDNSPNGGVIGYFWSKDNITKSNLNGSNERVMFYADAVMFANGDSGKPGWNITDPFPMEMVSTLAHEFQHMIHFYQKTILRTSSGTATDTWIDEMLAETTEDIVATKIRSNGPRAVSPDNGDAGDANNKKGRYPLFNQNNTLSLTTWTTYADYAKVSAFGTFLIRNYGGAQLLHDIMHNAYTDEQAVMDAVEKSAEGSDKIFDDLLKEWGVAVLLSDHDDLADLPFYNTGDFTYSTFGNSTYAMGSIDFFNYDPQPTIHTSAGTVSAQGNYYYKVGDNLTGEITIDLQLNGTTEATLVAK
ncbi:MAG: hypothetical protein U9Q90_02640 [Campylobacterota bacterium]|nr:hypothetical protein [Campylobacterota bacterium]